MVTPEHRRQVDRERQRRHRTGEPAPSTRRVYLKVAADTPAVISPACAQHDPDLWFSEDLADQARARLICAGCPALEACYVKAEANREQFGIWAGVDRAAKRKAGAA